MACVDSAYRSLNHRLSIPRNRRLAGCDLAALDRNPGGLDHSNRRFRDFEPDSINANHDNLMNGYRLFPGS
jgi:hypothetical protein